MQHKMIFLNHQPDSNEFKKELRSLGYGLFQSATIEKPVLIPKGNEVFLILRETSAYTIKTNILFLERWMEKWFENAPYQKIKHQSFFDKVKNNEINYIQDLLKGKDIMKDELIVRNKLSFKERVQKWFSKKQIAKSLSIAEDHKNTIISFEKYAIMRFAIYVWDKQKQQFSSSIDYHEIIDHPAVCIGTKTGYYTYRSNEIANYISVRY